MNDDKGSKVAMIKVAFSSQGKCQDILGGV
jgi:hypothetical protein